MLPNVDASCKVVYHTPPHLEHPRVVIVILSHLDHQLHLLVRFENVRPANGEEGETHISQVFECLLDIPGEPRPTYESILGVLTGRG